MRKDNFVYIEHILERAEKIIEFTKGMSKKEFFSDEKTQSAVIREIEVIGEAAKRVSEDFRINYSKVPWKIMAGMRDMLIHNYVRSGFILMLNDFAKILDVSNPDGETVWFSKLIQHRDSKCLGNCSARYPCFNCAT